MHKEGKMLDIIKKRRCMPVMVLFLAVVILGWTGGVVLAADNMTKKPMAAEKTVNEPAVIRFVDLSGVKDWRAEGLNSLLIQGNNSQWYRATLFSECFGLPWAEHIAFVTSPNGSLDQFSSILVSGQQCYFKNVEKIPAP